MPSCALIMVRARQQVDTKSVNVGSHTPRYVVTTVDLLSITCHLLLLSLLSYTSYLLSFLTLIMIQENPAIIDKNLYFCPDRSTGELQVKLAFFSSNEGMHTHGGKTALHYAASSGNLKLVESLSGFLQHNTRR